MDDEDILYDIYRDRLIGVPNCIGKTQWNSSHNRRDLKRGNTAQ